MVAHIEYIFRLQTDINATYTLQWTLFHFGLRVANYGFQKDVSSLFMCFIWYYALGASCRMNKPIGVEFRVLIEHCYTQF